MKRNLLVKTWHLWLALALSVAGLLYCFLAIGMVGSLAAGPGYSEERADYNFSIWTKATFLFGAATLLFIVSQVRAYHR